jgi:hypothetical protein
MCVGVALTASELPSQLIGQWQLPLHQRGGEAEVRFLFKQGSRCLPVWHRGQLKLVRWGSRRADSQVLPPTGWVWQASLEKGLWAGAEPELVDIPATMALEGGVWFLVRQGLRGVLVRDERGREAVYVLCEPASHYYQVMTGSSRMPVLIGERI